MEKVNLYDIYRDSEFYKKTYMKRYELSKDKNADVIELKEKRSSLQYSIDAVKSHFSILVFVSFLLVVAACILFPGYSYIIVPVIL